VSKGGPSGGAALSERSEGDGGGSAASEGEGRRAEREAPQV